MTPPDLPDDPADWPTDPFALLGVRPGSADADLKRAYNRLIRRFRPEHHPDQFRRVREAYEACVARSAWYRADPEPEPPESWPLPPPTAVVDDADRFWEQATAGRDADAYSGLVEMASSRPDRADVPLRLYWLLAVNPALDDTRTRHHWLAAALARSRLTGPAAELYRRELDADPVAAMNDPYQVFESPASAADLLAVARWRVAAAGRAGRWYVVLADLTTVRDRLHREAEGGWLGLLVAALDWAAWDDPTDLHAFCRAELGQLRHLELSHDQMFDRVEHAAHLGADGRAAANKRVPAEVVAAVRAYWAGFGDLRPEEVAAAAAVLAADPVRLLDRLDRVGVQHGPGFGAAVVRVLEAARRDEPVEFPPALVRGLARRLGVRKGRWLPEYPDLRAAVLGLLTAEALDPLEFAAALADDPDMQFRELGNLVGGDVSLRAVWLATRLHLG